MIDMTKIIIATLGIIPSLMINGLVNLILEKKDKWIYKFLPVALYFVAHLNLTWIGDDNGLIILPFFILVFMISFKGKFYEKLITGLILYTFMISSNLIIDTYIDKYLYIDMYNTHLGLRFLLKSAVILMIYPLVKKVLENKQVNLPRSLWLVIGGIIISPFMMTLSSTSLGIDPYAFDGYLLMAGQAKMVLPFAFLSSVVTIITIGILSRHEYLANIENTSKLREVYYESLKKEQDEIRIIKHDLNNHLLTLGAILDQDRIDDGKDYLRELQTKSSLTSSVKYCENELVNIILSSKMTKIKEYGLDYEGTFQVSNDLAMEDVDLSSLLSNGLDNAIEASGKTADKILKVQIREDKGLLVINILNSFSGDIIYGEEKIETSKANKKNHGFGITSMKEIVEKYKGILSIEHKNGKFSLLISIPI